MRKVQIITDSCSDLTPELMERYHINYAKMNMVFEAGPPPPRRRRSPNISGARIPAARYS